VLLQYLYILLYVTSQKVGFNILDTLCIKKQ